MQGSIFNYSPSMQNILKLLSDNYLVYLNTEVNINHKIKEKVKLFILPKYYLKNSSDSFFVKIKKFIKNTYQLLLSKNFKFVLVFDQHMLIKLDKSIYNQHKNICYYSLELYTKRDDNLKLEYTKYNYRKIRSIIIQSEERLNYLIQEHEFKKDVRKFYLPVTLPATKEIKIRKLNMDSKLRSVLFIGSLRDIDFIKELILVFKNITEARLHIHYIGNNDRKDFLEKYTKAKNITNVDISNEFIESQLELEIFTSKFDIGLAWYEYSTVNDRTAGLSSGKIALFTKIGLPIITNEHQSFKENIENNNCGLCIENFKNIRLPISKIMDDYNYYSRNSKNTFNKTYCFDNYILPLRFFLES
jgi:hypothetical protein